MRCLLAALCLLTLLPMAAPAAAQEAWAPSAPSAPGPQTEEDTAQTEGNSTGRWYGWQTLMVDLGAFVLMAAALAVDDRDTSPGLALTGIGGAVLGAPIVHWAHGHGTEGLASLGMRLGAILLGLAAVPLLGAGDHFGDDPAVGLGVAFAGWVMASMVDAAILAFD